MSIRTPVVAARRQIQAQRIQQGVQSGQITKKEAQRLGEKRQDFAQMVKDAKADGVVTKEERQELRQAQNEMSQDIFAAKHNDKTRDKTPLVDARQARQGGRIAEGVQSGELTRAEAKELRSDRREIRQAERAAKADGVVSKEERQELHGMLNDLSKDIFEMKHNDDKRRRLGFI